MTAAHHLVTTPAQQRRPSNEVPRRLRAPVVSAIPDVGPDTLATRLEQLRERHLAGHLLAAVTELLAPHTSDWPTHTGPPPSVPTAVVIRLHQLLPSWPAIGLPAAVLHAAEPWLRHPAAKPDPDPFPVAALDFEHPAPEPDPDDAPELSHRERQVLRGLAAGHGNEAIGRRLGLTENTVKTHLRRIYRRLGARDRAHAVDIGWRLRLLP